ncbi:hypothetical protein MYX77_00345 [Acidobacteriia bacterium AH_259_A11_L15]|nr:hypothetical protein [Acidobacteriia bacterium AH_259_A11_L15]
MNNLLSQPLPLALLGVLALVVIVLLFRARSAVRKEVPRSAPPGESPRPPERIPVRERDSAAIYQLDRFGTKQRLVGRVINAQVDEAKKEIRFGELYNSDEFSLPDECEFQKYRIIVRQVGDSTKVDKENPHKGRVLWNVVAELLGYSEQ